MIAGLPKPTGLMILTIAILAIAVWIPSAGQDAPIPLEPPASIVTAVESNPLITEEGVDALLSAIDDALAGGAITEAGVLELLEQFSWPTLVDPDELAAGFEALMGILDGLNSGEIVEDPAGGLTGPGETPAGIETALARGGADPATIDLAGALIAEGTPPGIVLHVARDALADGADPAAALERLAGSLADGASPGQAANEAIGRGSFQHRDREANQNLIHGEPGDPPSEVEQNQHGVAAGPPQTKPGKGRPKG